jgi:hypothetical protein
VYGVSWLRRAVLGRDVGCVDIALGKKNVRGERVKYFFIFLV